MCYDDPDNIDYSVEENDDYEDEGMSHVIEMMFASGSRCQLPIDGENTEGF